MAPLLPDMKPIASKYFDDFFKDLPSVEGKTFVITGTTSGTGHIAARTVALKGGVVVCLNRPSKRVEESMKKLREAAPNGTFYTIDCDLQDFETVQSAASQIQSQFQSIYCLGMNAGIAMTVNKATTDGCDDQMQTNHLSHFVLIAQLLSLLEAGARAHGEARIVFHSSEARHMTEHKKIEQKYLERNGGNLGDDGKSMFFVGGRMKRYTQSKLANSVMMYALHEKLKAKESKIRAIACHPGGSSTNLGDASQLPYMEFLFMKYVMVPFVFQSAEDGTMPLLKAMMMEDAESGALYGPAYKMGLNGPPVINPPKPYENDPEAMEMIWKVSEETTGVSLNI